MTENYTELRISFNKDNYDSIYNCLYKNGIEYILEEDEIIVLYFMDGEERKIGFLKDELFKIQDVNEKSVRFRRLGNKNWNEEWEKSVEPVYIKDKFIITPSWKSGELRKPEGKIVIVIDPKMSFGTGHNETTQLMLEFICDYISAGDEKILDYGCGTGVLAIAAVKSGVKKAYAVDIDEESIENAKEYFEFNGVSGNITLLKTDITGLKEYDFDVIYANIIRSVIESNIKSIYNKLKPGGKLFISGILKEEEDKIKKLLDDNSFTIVEINSKSEWLGIYALKK